jgi:hypothetical protein
MNLYAKLTITAGLFLALTIFLFLTSAQPAMAQSCTTIGTQTFCDPASFHITDSSATGTDPVLLNEATTFNVDDVDNGATINKPLTIFFAVPTADMTSPSVTKFDFDGGAFTTTGITISSLGVWNPQTVGDLYTFVGCTACDNSINTSNVDTAEAALGFGMTPEFNVYSLTIQQAFGGNTDFETIDGLFPLGTLIAPLASDVETNKTTFYDTAWTNTGEVNLLAAPAAPEPSTWVMLIAGFGLIGLLGWRKRHAAVVG